MKRFFLAAAAAFALAACSDTSTNPVAGGDGPQTPGKQPTGVRGAVAPVGPRWNIFTSQTPEAILDATGGWEVGTRFRSSKSGKVIGFRFWRAAGETGTNTGRLWTDGGTQKASANFPSGTGWVTVNLASPVAIPANTDFRVSVNTNTAQAKAFSVFTNGPVTNGPLSANSGLYGQPTGAMPTSGSVSAYFIDVIFEEDVPLPNLYVAVINPTFVNQFGQPIVLFRICNNGPGSAAASTTRYWHWRAPLAGGTGWWSQYSYGTPALGPGGCVDFTPVDNSEVGYHHEYHVWADINDVVYESNEGDNYSISSWNRTF